MNKESTIAAPESQRVKAPALLYEMIRSFVTLADTLNLSQAVKQLDSTRQTVRRHIAHLEEIKGGELFEVKDRRYSLSLLGVTILPEARDLMANASAWLLGNAGQINGLQYLMHGPSEGHIFYQQQHQVDRVFSSSGKILQEVLEGWARGGGQLQHEALREVRRYCIIFRRMNGDLVFTEVGDDSSFLSWFGADIAESTIGRRLGQMPGGEGFGRLVDIAYAEIEMSQAIRLDHIHTVIPKPDLQELVPISYERMMLGARFPDQSPAIISVVRRTYDIEIKGVTAEIIKRMPEEYLMS